jgi:DnaJ like chaperone protein
MNTFFRLANTIMRAYLATPVFLRWVYWLLPVIYFLMPADLLPDFIPGLGRVDDLLLMAFVFWALSRAKLFTGFFREASGQKNNRRQSSSSAGGATRPPDDPYQVLGVPAGAAKSEIKKAYRKMIGMYHPDRFTHLGPEFEETARKKTEAILAAYQQLTR